MTTVKSYAVLNNINEVSRGDNFFKGKSSSLNKTEKASFQFSRLRKFSQLGVCGNLFSTFVKGTIGLAKRDIWGLGAESWFVVASYAFAKMILQ